MTTARQDILIAQLRTAMTKPERRAAVRAFEQAGPAEDRAAVDREFRAFLQNAPATPVEMRAMGETTASAGGNIVAPGFASDVIRLMREFDSVLNDMEPLRTPKGGTWARPQVSSFTAQGGAVAEGTQLTDSSGTLITFINTQAFGKTPTYPALMVASFQLAQDANVDLAGLMASAAGEAIGRQVAADATTALYAAAPAGQQVALSGSAVTNASVAGLLANLDPAYLPGCKLYVSAGDYAKLVVDDPVKLRAFPVPVVPTNAVTDYTAATVSGPVLARMDRFMSMRRVGGVRVQVLRERYADLGQIGVLVSVRADFQARGEDSAAVFSK